jgi:hypothetical protein
MRNARTGEPNLRTELAESRARARRLIGKGMAGAEVVDDIGRYASAAIKEIEQAEGCLVSGHGAAEAFRHLRRAERAMTAGEAVCGAELSAGR